MIAPRVSASLWSVPTDRLEDEARRLAAAGLRTWHWDRSDGSMAPAGGFTAAGARELARMTGLASEAHLMLAEPLLELEDWLAFCDVVIVHAAANGVDEALARIAAAGARGAIAYAPGDAIDDQGRESDALVMSVEPGHGGAVFDPVALERIASLSPRRPRVGVDGGVTVGTARAAISAGATWIVSGTALIADPDPFLA